MSAPRRRLASIACACAFACAFALALGGCTPPGDAGPARLDELPIGVWNSVPLAGDARCADGSAYAALVRRGDPDVLIVTFEGGGATWGPLPGASALVQPLLGELYVRQVSAAATTGLAAPPVGDPLAAATQVRVSYCSGDVHWGDADGLDASGRAIVHRGAANVAALLGWLDDQALAPSQLAIVGCSAGGYGALLWAPSLQERFPLAGRSLLLDAALGVVQTPFVTDEVGLAAWNVAGAFADNGVAALLDTLDVTYFERLVEAVAATFDGPIGIATTDRDVVQAAFWYLMGEERSGFRVVSDVDAWSALAMARLARLGEIDGVGTFVSAWSPSSGPTFTFGTTGHCLSADDDLWRDGAGASFRAWWDVLRAGGEPTDVDLRD